MRSHPTSMAAVQIGPGTRVLVTHTGFGDRATAAEGTGKGWKRVLEWLGEHVSR